MKLSIIICTFNRSFELEQLLEDICSQHKKLESQKDIEIILVDNNSFDNTAEVVYRFVENTELSIKYFTEKKLGLSACRNFAVTKASGDLLAFIHDDINLDEDWLKEAYQLALGCHDQEIGVFGGLYSQRWAPTTRDILRRFWPQQPSASLNLRSSPVVSCRLPRQRLLRCGRPWRMPAPW